MAGDSLYCKSQLYVVVLVVLACLVPAPVFAFHPVLSKLDFIVNYAVYPEIDYGGGEQSATRRLCQLQ